MPKPTSPQPPETLSDEECERLAAQIGYGTTPDDCAMIRLGWEARGKRDAEDARGYSLLASLGCCRRSLETFAVAIERTPEQPTTKRCPRCGSYAPELPRIPEDAIDNAFCTDPWHSQPEIGETNPADDPNVRIEDIRGK